MTTCSKCAHWKRLAEDSRTGACKKKRIITHASYGCTEGMDAATAEDVMDIMRKAGFGKWMDKEES